MNEVREPVAEDKGSGEHRIMRGHFVAIQKYRGANAGSALSNHWRLFEPVFSPMVWQGIYIHAA
jgi:hypothetical protein